MEKDIWGVYKQLMFKFFDYRHKAENNANIQSVFFVQ